MNILNEFELGILDALQVLRCPFLDGFLSLFAYLFELGFLWIVISAILLCFPKHRRCGIAILLAMGVGLLICNVCLKSLVMRDRPYWVNPEAVVTILKPIDYSFPSGHAVHSMIGASVITSFYPKWGFAVIPIALLTGFSRLYFYIHFPTDVLFGTLIGAAIGFTVAYFCKKWLAQPFYFKRSSLLWMKKH